MSKKPTYTEQQLQKIHENEVVKKLGVLREKLVKAPELANFKIGQPDISTPQDPGLLIENVHRHVNIYVKMQLTGKTVILSLRPTSNLKPEVTAFSVEIQHKIRYPYTPKKQNKYAQAFDEHSKVGDASNISQLDSQEVIKRIVDNVTRLKDRI